MRIPPPLLCVVRGAATFNGSAVDKGLAGGGPGKATRDAGIKVDSGAEPFPDCAA